MHSAPESPSYSLPSPISEITITATTPPSTRDPGKSGFFTSTEQHQHFENIKTKGRSDTAGTLDEYLVSIYIYISKLSPLLLLLLLLLLFIIHYYHTSQKNITNFFLKNIQQGPRDPAIHSKVPCFMRLHGSILPKMIVPVLVVGIWATAVTLVSKHVHSCMTFFFFFFFYPFPISYFPFPISHFPFPISHFPFPISHFPFPISHFPFPISHFPFPISQFLILEF